MDETFKLLNTFANKALNDDEFGLYRTMLSYVDLQLRLVIIDTEKRAKEEGLTDEDLRGYSSFDSGQD